MKSPLLLLIFASVLVVGCGGSSPLAPTAASPSSPISPSLVGGGNGPTRLKAGEVLPPPAPEVDGIACPSDAPAFKAEATPGHVVKLEWQKMPKADYIRIYVWVEHFGQ